MSRTKVNRTFSFTQDTIQKLELLMTATDNSNASEYIRLLIDNECSRQNINLEKDVTYNTNTNKPAKSEIIRKLNEIELLLSKLNYRLGDNNLLTYEIRDTVNSYAEFVGCDYVSADKDIPGAKPHDCITQSEDNYNNKLRRLSIEKANKK